jgi:hypothetical protein
VVGERIAPDADTGYGAGVDLERMSSDAEHAGPSLKVEVSPIRVFFWLALEALFVGVWLWIAATSNSWLGRAACIMAAGSQAKQWLDRRPLLGRFWVRIDADGIVARLPDLDKSIGWELIEHIEMRRVFGAMLMIYLKRPDEGSWLRRLDARVNRGRFLPSYVIGRLMSNSDIGRMQSFIDAHYASRTHGANGSKPPTTEQLQRH